MGRHCLVECTIQVGFGSTLYPKIIPKFNTCSNKIKYIKFEHITKGMLIINVQFKITLYIWER